jgi:uncharacterized membrane protein HdeD (DUF308 family)
MLPYLKTVVIYGGIFSTIAGVYELYESIRERNTKALGIRVAIQMTGGFIYGASLYLWQLPALYGVFLIGRGFYAKTIQ